MAMPNILRRKQVEQVTGLSRSTIYLKISRNEFPRPVSLGDRAVGWIQSEIENWIAGRIKQSRQQAKGVQHETD